MSVRRNPVHDNTIAHMNDTVEVGGGLGVVGDHDNGLAEVFVQTAQHFEDDFGIFGVEVAGRLVSKQNFWLVDDGASDGHALLFAARHFGWLVSEAAVEAEHFGDDVEAMGIEAVAMNVLGDGDIAFGGERGEEVEALKDEADFAAAELGALGIAHFGQIVAVNKHSAFRGLRQPADDVEQRRLAAARWAHHRDRFAGLHLEVHATQRRDFYLTSVVELPKIFGFEYRLHAYAFLAPVALCAAV